MKQGNEKTWRAKRGHAAVRAVPSPSGDTHPVDRHVGQQIRIRRIQSNVSLSDLAAGIGVSFQQVQKYENGKNRVSASMLYEVASCLRMPVSRFFDGLPEPASGDGYLAVAEIDERIAYISTSEGRQLIEDVLQLSPRLRSRVAQLVSSMAEEQAMEA
ncbi:Transcriptional regulator, contains XRE-family HTH domain [Rhizobium tibeticum]|uniref:Transcriptional regulator, contains XRE-family HTH domain n=1 Tax=Rhizobium tibeticum TaxID=501024 RepID=A0A1H8H287_9HYPH|nr:helix-turn-helix transcriptional regulator [Rhizobium tibeticum]SEH63796.1 transcriptional regulator, y4mF family [Rhizobium tibeticum]SEN50084.1 Transcriptional regulator, contains XRE-family HTH domain [Rhizobium tibeticum]